VVDVCCGGHFPDLRRCILLRFLVEPENPGFGYRPLTDKSGQQIGIVISLIQPGSAAAKAGLEPDDIIVPSKSDGFLSRGGGVKINYLEPAVPIAWRLSAKKKANSFI